MVICWPTSGSTAPFSAPVGATAGCTPGTTAYTGLVASPGNVKPPLAPTCISGLKRASVEPPRPLTKPVPVRLPPPDRSSVAPSWPCTLAPMKLRPMVRLRLKLSPAPTPVSVTCLPLYR